MSVLVRGGVVAGFSPPAALRADLRIRDGEVVERGPDLPPVEGETLLDASGCLVTPGLVCAHTHLYSTLARGMPPPERAPGNFLEILERIWWRLDRALDGELVSLSARAGLLDALACGVTTIIDHHASPEAIHGSLARIGAETERAGVRAVLAYEVTDRNGRDGARAGIEEHRAALKAGQSETLGILVGAHASFTLSDETLGAAIELAREHGSGLHIHVAEDVADVEDAVERGFRDPVERLASLGGLGANTVLAHGVHLGEAAYKTIRDAGAWIVANPRSNMNNAVGTGPFALHPATRALGTDGIGADLLAELRALYWKSTETGAGISPEGALGYLAGGQRLAGRLLGVDLESLTVGAAADLVVFDYPSPTPVTAANFASHCVFGLDSRHVRDVLVAGRPVVLGRRLLTLDRGRILSEARAGARRLWERMRTEDLT